MRDGRRDGGGLVKRSVMVLVWLRVRGRRFDGGRWIGELMQVTIVRLGFEAANACLACLLPLGVGIEVQLVRARCGVGSFFTIHVAKGRQSRFLNVIAGLRGLLLQILRS